jgi:actin-like ATPase involved in cell morphogenesis
LLGIDLGTGSARAAYCAGQDAVPVRVADPSGGLSAVVSFAVEPPRFGQAALGYLVTDPQRSLRNLTRYLAIDTAHGEPGGPAVSVSAGDGKVTFALPGASRSAADVVACWLDELHAQACRQAGLRFEQAVVSFPIGFDHLAHAQLEQALRGSALGAASLVIEPVASAIGLCPAGPERDVLIVDVGAGELSASILHLSDRHASLPQLSHAEREPIGGEAVDQALIALAEHKLGARFQGPVRELLRQYCQTMKHELSSAPSTSCMVPGYLFGRAEGAQLGMDAAELVQCLEPVLALVEAACERLRSAAGLRLGTNVELYVLGGTMRLGPVRTRVEQLFGVPARHVRDPGHAIASGCALIGARHATTLRESAHTPRLTLPPVRPIRGSSQPPELLPPNLRAPRAPAVSSDLARLAAEAEAEAAPRPLSSVPPRRASSQSLRPPSQPLITTASQRSAPPSGAPRTSIAPSDLKAGAVRNAITAEAFLRLPLSRAPTPEDLDPVSLPLLFMVLRHPSRFGTLELKMEGMEPLRFQIADGMAFLGGLEHKWVLEAFRAPKGSYTLEVKPYKEQPNKEAHMIMSLLVDAMKEVVKRFESEVMIAALGERLQRAPFVGPRHARLIAKLPLLPMEQRIVKYTFNGQEAAHLTLEHLGVRRQSTLGLMMLLSVYDLIEWQEPPQSKEATLEEALNARALEVAEANYFQVLGLHWSALDEEVDEAYEKLLHELGQGQPVHDAAPVACEKILERVHEAYEILSDETRRAHYRRQAYPNLDMSAVADFLRTKERSWALRSDGAAEVAKARSRREGLKQKRRPKS